MHDMTGFLEQKRISGKNMARLRQLHNSDDEDVRRIAELVLEVARVTPHKKKRRRYLYENRPDLFALLVEECFFLPWGEGPEMGQLAEERWRAEWTEHGPFGEEEQARITADLFGNGEEPGDVPF